MQKNKIKEKGMVSIYTTMMIMMVSLGMVLGLAAIFVGYLRIIRGIGDSVVAHYAANTGIERLLYEDKICRRPSPCPTYCVLALPDTPNCRGLVSPHSILNIPLNNGAFFEARFSRVDGREYFESIGTFEGARRAIRVTR